MTGPEGWPEATRTAKRSATLAILAAIPLVAVCLAQPGLGATAGSPQTAFPSVPVLFGSAQPAPTNFWGMNLLADKPPGTDFPGLVNATPTTTVVYPGGNLTESMNLTSGVIYGPNSTERAAISLEQFVSFCTAIACRAIIGLPMEINDPATDAYEAEYIVDVLHFHPQYFVYGNEPAHWSCFGLSWTQLGMGHPCDTGNTTIPAFANETASAIRDVRAALGGTDVPAALCLGGTGKQGPGNETNWIRGLEANTYDASACAAYGMHVKAAHSQTVSPTLANFYASLIGPQGLAADYQNVSGETDGKPLYMTEVGAFTPKSVFTPVFIGTWAMDVLDSALVVQAMENRLPTMGWWAWSTGGADGLYYNGSTTEFYSIYSSLFPQLSSTWYSSQWRGQEGLFAEATSNRTSWSMLAVSTNITQTFRLDLNESGFPIIGCATLDLWTSAGRTVTSDCDLDQAITLPGQSVLLVTLSTRPTFVVSFSATNLAPDAEWSVELNGTDRTAVDGFVNFTEASGSYPYAVDPPTSFAVEPSLGTVAVAGGTSFVPLTFTELFDLSFSATDLPSDTNWSVTLGGNSSLVVLVDGAPGTSVTHWSNGSALVRFFVSNGTYTFSAVAAGYPAFNGTVTVAGQSPPAIAVPLGPTSPTMQSSAADYWWVVIALIGAVSVVVAIEVVVLVRRRRGRSGGGGPESSETPAARPAEAERRLP